jgi:peptidoglycan/xylan/chitin deacetylase (PgdA/CDA1 family)
MMTRSARRVVRDLAARLVAPVAAPIYSGVGSILAFHRVVDPPAWRAGWARDMEVRPAALAALVAHLRRAGHAFVSMDELREALLRSSKPPAKLVAMTFDDGYADAHDTVLPLLESHGVPFALYLTTDLPDRSLVPWWYLLERVLTQGPRVALQHRGQVWCYRLERLEERDLAFAELARLFMKSPTSDHRALADSLFGPDAVARAMAELYLSWDQVAAMARHPLVTIGAHTVSHRPLAALPLDEARREVVESRRRIEARTGRPVRHFAYPYGQPTQAGPREFALVRECGFDTAVTTRHGNVFPAHAASLACLPRLPCEAQEDAELLMSGVRAAFLYRGRRVITA